MFSLQGTLVTIFFCFPALQDPAASINAAVAVACLVGHQEENNKRLQLDEKLVGKMLDVLDAACQVRGSQAGPEPEPGV